VTRRAFYTAAIESFLDSTPELILGFLANNSLFPIETTQRDAWLEQICILLGTLQPYRSQGKVYFEYSIPRLGKRIDVVLLVEHVIFVIEFKVGETEFTASATDQVFDYALDLKNFHETSHDKPIAPILVATRAKPRFVQVFSTAHNDGLLYPVHATPATLSQAIEAALAFCHGRRIDPEQWERGRYRPTPTIIEAAMALYGGHDVSEISRSDASAINLSRTSDAISEIIRSAKASFTKSICFVTGVPGAGKTLVGLNIATKHMDKASELYSVFLSGNGPLVSILREALARDKVHREAELGKKLSKRAAMSEVAAFIQNVHHFRDDCLVDAMRPPIEHVALFDEAQRAWNVEQTASFMLRKRQRPDFNQSEPEFLISCLDRHNDWAVIVCLVGGGQEINTGEAGISEWIRSLQQKFSDWHIHISPRLYDSEYGAGEIMQTLSASPWVHFEEHLHLSVSMRSFRAEHVSTLVKHVLDIDDFQAREALTQVADRYPILITRNLAAAKDWVRKQARGSERYGMIVSSQAQRLKPHAIDVRSPMDPIHWFLDGKEDVRSSYYLEDVATEFHVQGLELDWACVVWDADFRYVDGQWQHFSFVGDRWNRILKDERKQYLKNAYRVLLTRARQGMVIVVPHGDDHDPSRAPTYYDSTFNYLAGLGLTQLYADAQERPAPGPLQ
jgi:hypothetical protein